MRFSILAVLTMGSVMSVAGNAGAENYDYGSSEKALSFSWTGPYIGVDAGYGVGSTDWDFSNGSTVSNDQNGGIVGFHAGYNQQLSSSLVVGVEGSVNGTDMYGHSSCLGGGYSCRTDVNMLADLSGRVGLAFGRGLVFGKGGIAYQDATHSVQQVSDYNNNQTDRGGSVGFLLGLGGEYALTYNISARIEYDFMAFSDDTSSYSSGLTSKDKSIDNVIKAGMSLKLY